jgi:hypothetical protein
MLGGDNLVTHAHNDEAYRCWRKTLAVSFSNDSLKKQVCVGVGVCGPPKLHQPPGSTA